ncbi:MAG: hypothetical protein QOD99_915 [Chthoniobacter sp.]|jgi:filamentous hemagglutinin family protein|nr:hypothetical protein [Chthoniobacter sp.]
MRRSACAILGRAGLFLLCSASALHAGIVADGSLGPGSSLSGPNFSIPASLGKKAGPNLFHSFSTFNIAMGESATFSGPADVQNVLARVTGGSASSIDGLLRSTIANANFFLINPRGVMFGPNASVDVGGAFVVTTGDHVAFADGSRFNASPGATDAILTMAPPAAFGFLSAHSGVISMQGSHLTSAAGKTLAMAGGEVQMKDATLNASAIVIRGGKLTMDHSKITVAATTAGDGANIQMESSVALTNLSSIETTAFADFAHVTVTSVSAPAVSLTGGSTITSLGSGDANVGNLEITAESVEIIEGSRLDANTSDAGTGGDIRVQSHDISVRDLGSGIGASTADIGAGGNIHLITRNLKIGAGGIVQTSTVGPGPGGNVHVNAVNVSIIGGSSFQTGISADTLGGDGAAGTVRLTLSGQLVVAGGAQVSSDTFGAGTGGDVIIAAQSAVVDGRGLPAFTAISTETQNADFGGPGGNILLNIRDTLRLIGGGQVTASTFGPGTGGSIGLRAAHVFISGQGAASFPGINASTTNQTAGGRGGDVRLNLSGRLEIVQGGKIAVSTSGLGAGGSVNISAPAVLISGIDSSISAKTLYGLHGGRGGNIVIATDLLQGREGGEISASTAGSGAGGSIQINATRLALDNFRISADTSSPSTFALPVTVTQLNVSLDINHTSDQNLDVALFGPDGTLIDLFNGVGGTGQNFRNTVLADDAPTPIGSGAAPFTGRFQPQTPLAAFDGKVFNGLWILILFDPDLSDVATLNSWSLTTGGITISSPDVPKTLPNPDGSSNNLSFLPVNVPPAAIVPITPGKGGDVRIHAGSVSLLGGARISSESLNTGAGGPGGGILVTAGDMNIIGRKGIETGISAKSFGAGASGSVQLKLGNLTLDSHAFVGSSNIGSGDAGSVQIHADDGVVLHGASLITTSAAKANAGVIEIESGAAIELRERSSITASAGANGGSIRVTAPDLVYLADSSITATAGSQQVVTGAAVGTGGNIFIDPQFIVLDSSLISANAAVGQGGNINLFSGFFLNSDSLITATGAQAGTVNIAAPELDLSASLITLPGSLLSAETQLRERCTTKLRGDFSSFISLGRGGAAEGPDELAPSF